MFLRLLFLFTVVPIIELLILIELGQLIGSLPTIGIVLVTGIVGAALAKQQGWVTWKNIHLESSQGRVPSDSLLDGLLILIGGVTLLTPGIITDIFGFSLLIPVTRRVWKLWLKALFQRWVESGNIQFFRWR